MAKDQKRLSSTSSPGNGSLTVDQAAATIVQLINSQPRSPRQAEVAAIVARASAAPPLATPTLALDIRSVIQDIHAADAQLALTPESGPAWAALQGRLDVLWNRLKDLATKLPLAPSTLPELLMIAELAHYWSDKREDGSICVLNAEDASPDDYWAARLIQAAPAMGGRHHV